MSEYHKPVMLSEVLGMFGVAQGKQYIDATLGGGGHTVGIVERGGIVLGIDTDEDAITYVCNEVLPQLPQRRLTIAKGNFRDIKAIAKENGFEEVDGVLFDLGVSSHQLEESGRGFSFLEEGPLNMRMSREIGVSAADLVNALGKKELYELFTKFGEEPYAHAIAKSIVRARAVAPILTTKELIAAAGIPDRKGDKGRHAVTRVFQALRIAVNDELNNIREALPQALDLLAENGRVIVISFHSLEDRIVKESFKKFEDEGKGRIITAKPLTPSEKEQRENHRARSAKLRVFEKRKNV